MQFRAVDYFLAVVEHGTLRGAAQTLGVTQPALTKAIRRLEDETGVRLFDRRARGVTLTAYGEVLARHARSMRANLQDANEELAALRQGVSGRIRVGAGPTWYRTILPRAVAAFRLERPAVRLHVVGGLDEGLKTQLRAGSLDFVLAVVPDAPLVEPDLECRALFGDDYRVIAAHNHPLRSRAGVSPADLLDYPWILPSTGTHMVERLQILFRARALAPPVPVVETDIQSLKLALMRDAQYLSFHAESNLSDLGAPEIGPLDVPGMAWHRRTGIIMRRGVRPNLAAQGLIAIIERLCADGRSSTTAEGSGPGG